MLALQRAGIPVECYDAFEIDKYALTVSKHNFPVIVHHGNVYDGDFTQFKGYDLLLGGSPCTYWSIAKKDREIDCNGEGFRLFKEYVRALEESGCKYFLYENNYSVHKNITDEITKVLGVEPIMINSALVSAQNRKRCYWTNIPNVTQPEDKGIILADILEDGISWQDKSYCMTSSYNGAVLYNTLERKQRTMAAVPIRIGQYGKGGQGQRIYSVRGKSVTLSANGGGQGAKTGLYKIDLPDGDYVIRKLTPIEAERLQTLPDDYTAGISNTQRYKCIGNAWTADVIAHILRGLKNE
jgi:DNA (cytosine-5)-methyltransferase 3A